MPVRHPARNCPPRPGAGTRPLTRALLRALILTVGLCGLAVAGPPPVARAAAGDPIGAVEPLTSPAPATVRFTGWAFDPDVPNGAIKVRVFLGGPVGTPDAQMIDITADRLRAELPSFYPGVSAYHGFDSTVTTTKRGTQAAYLYALNYPGTPGGYPLIGSGTVQIVGYPLQAGTPTISGSTFGGSQLTADPGAWGPAPVSLSYQWLRNGSPIAGATGRTRLLATADLGTRISVRVTGSRTDYQTTTRTSAEVGPIRQGGFVPVTPARLLETRAGLPTVDGRFAGTGAIGQGGTAAIQAAGRAGIPWDGVAAVVVNITAVQPTADTYLTAFTDGILPPLASTMNLQAGQVYANLAVVRVDQSGSFQLFNAKGRTHATVDIVGYYPTGGSYAAVAPARLTDTRRGAPTVDGRQSGAGPLGPGTTRLVTVTGRAGIPSSGVAAVVVNITGVAPTRPTYLTAFPAGGSRPVSSTVNLQPLTVVPSMAVVKVGTDGAIAVFNDSGTTDLVVDVLGWIPAGTPYLPVSPARLLDTRTTGPALGPGATRTVQVTGRLGIPATARSVVLAVTAVLPSSGTYLTVYQAGTARPGVSTVNVAARDTRANAAYVRLSGTGALTVYNAVGTTHVLVDVVGYTN